MTDAAFTVESTLVMKTNVPELMAQLGKAFREVNEQISGVKGGLREFVNTVKSRRYTPAGVRKWARAGLMVREVVQCEGALHPARLWRANAARFG